MEEKANTGSNQCQPGRREAGGQAEAAVHKRDGYRAVAVGNVEVCSPGVLKNFSFQKMERFALTAVMDSFRYRPNRPAALPGTEPHFCTRAENP